jgi:peptidoglycan hydrolase CwlO-like protein
MKKTQFLSMLIVVCFLGMGICTIAFADQGAYPGSNGKPFQALQAQITDLEASLDEKLAALWTSVGELQAAIDANNARDDAQDALISMLGGALAQLETRVAVNESAIEDLVAKDAVQDALIAALQGKADDLQLQINAQGDKIELIILADQTLQQLIDALAGRVTTLEGLMAAAAGDVTAHQAQIVILQQQMGNAQSAIATKQNLIFDYCDPNYSIRAISSSGSVTCEYDSVATGGFTSFSVEKYFAEADAVVVTAFTFTSVTATCPSGSKRTGGGFYLDNDLMFAFGSYPYGSNSWKTMVRGSLPLPSMYKSYINCLKLN